MRAIDAIRKHKTLYEADHGWDKTTLDALDTAIKALEQPTIEPERIGDPDRIYAELSKVYNMKGLPDDVYSIIGDLMISLPDEPERKKGKWLFKERRESVYDLSGVKTWGIAYMCSECGFIHTVIEDFGQYAYCPNSNCGAEMAEEKE